MLNRFHFCDPRRSTAYLGWLCHRLDSLLPIDAAGSGVNPERDDVLLLGVVS